jgi:CBS domain-containing protein
VQTTIASVLKKKGNDVWAVSPSASVSDALHAMTQKRIEALLVLFQDKLVGITTERDCARKVMLQGKDSKNVRVSEIMTSPVTFVSPQHTVGTCMWIITEKGITHLPVVEGETVVGVVSIGDLMKSIVESQSETIAHLEGYISGKYPA